MFSSLLLVLVLVGLNALYVAAEFASVSVKSIRIQALAEEGNATAQRLLPHLQDSSALDRYVAACQIGITVSSLVLGVLANSDWPLLWKHFSGTSTLCPPSSRPDSLPR